MAAGMNAAAQTLLTTAKKPAQIPAASAQIAKTISIRLAGPLGSDSNHAGDRFVGTLAEPLVMGNRIVAQRDAVVTGQVRETVSAGGDARPNSHAASITLIVRTVETRDARYPVETMGLTVKEDSNAVHNVLIIGGAAEAGVNGDAAGGREAALGSLPANGTKQSAFLTGKGEIRLPKDTLLTFYMTTRTISPKQRA